MSRYHGIIFELVNLTRFNTFQKCPSLNALLQHIVHFKLRRGRENKGKIPLSARGNRNAEREQQHSTEAHQRIRQNPDRRNEEQIRNTEAHRHVRLLNPE